jgi:hypothetical protein
MSSIEKIMSHYKTLKSKHDDLDKQIDNAYNHYTDDVEIHKMKVEKLHLKEEMSQLELQIGLENGKRIPSRY